MMSLQHLEQLSKGGPNAANATPMPMMPNGMMPNFPNMPFAGMPNAMPM